MSSPDSPAMVLLWLLSLAATFILWSQFLDVISGGRLFNGRPFSKTWQRHLSLVITMAPLAGLLGTVSGLRLAFAAMGHNEQQLAAGLAEALVTTKIGLLVALLALLLSNLLRRLFRVRT